MLPATIRVAPNSPRARAKESAVPLRMPGSGKGKRNEEEDPFFHQAEGASGVLQLRVDAAKGGLAVLEHQGKGNDKRGNNGGHPCEDDRESQLGKKEAQRAALPEEDEEQITGDGRREHEGKEDEGFPDAAKRNRPGGEKARQSEPDDKRDGGGKDGNAQRKQDG